MKRFLAVLLVAGVLAGGSVYAQQDEPTSAFKQYKTVGPFGVLVPTVVSIPLEYSLDAGGTLVVQDKNTGIFVASLVQRKDITPPVTYTARIDEGSTLVSRIVDGDYDSAIQFNVQDTGPSTVRLVLKGNKDDSVSKMRLALSPHVSLPRTVQVEAWVNNAWQTVVATKPMSSSEVLFPETKSNTWRISLTFVQPLRIAEIQLSGQNRATQTAQEIRFLAQPDTTYAIYMNADRSVSVPTEESPALSSDTDVLAIAPVPTVSNPLYTPADIDDDGVPDLFDNCVRVSNENQEDINQNGRGDACDDFDKDGKINSEDNCPNDPNRLQKDEDGDGIGDACDSEESRFTEKNPWIPWAGMGGAAVVLIILFALVATQTKREDEGVAKEKEEDSTPKEDAPKEGDTEMRP